MTSAALLLLASPLLHVDAGRFVDDAGGVVVLRGFDVAGDAKVPPFTPAADPAIFDPLPALGANVVRLLFTWEAYEPTPGAYDAAYLDSWVAAAHGAFERGLLVVCDFHQDGFSRFALSGCGDGFPQWALPAGQTPAVPDNGPACESWGAMMTQDDDMKAAFTAFYADTGGVRSAYMDMVRSVATRLAGEPGVVGYDLLNEPWGDEVLEIGPFHEEATAAIREIDPTAIVFTSPRALTSAGLPTDLPIPGYANRAYAPHYYDAGVVLFGDWDGTPVDAPFASMSGTAATWDAPLFLGEYGAPPDTTNALAYVDAIRDALDAGFHSGAQWAWTPGWTPEKKDGWNVEDFSVVDDQGDLRENFRPRAAPRRIAGAPVSFAATVTSVDVAWEHDGVAGATEIFVPWDDFGAAPRIVASGATCTREGTLLRCTGAGGPASVHVEPGETPAGGCNGCNAGGRSDASFLAALLGLLASLRARARRTPGTPGAPRASGRARPRPGFAGGPKG